jgi:transcriptional regulator with XRE-family HTH domain
MSNRSLQASPRGIEKAQKALIHYLLTQESLAKELGVTRQPIINFLRGRPVSYSLFVQICNKLNLDWQEVVAIPNGGDEPAPSANNVFSRSAAFTGRSLQVSPEGIKKALTALVEQSLTQKALAEELGITRPPVGKFFGGKLVDRNLFVQICDRLNLNWEEVVAKPGSGSEADTSPNNISYSSVAFAGRSLQASPEGIKKAQTALIRQSLTQNALAEELQISRSTVSKFFNGHPVDRLSFEEICNVLDLDWVSVVVKRSSKELETIDLPFQDGIDWKAFAHSFKEVQVENKDTQLDVQSIEKKGDGVLIVRVGVSPDTNKTKIHSDFMQGYEFARKELEEKYQAQLRVKEEQINQLFTIVNQQFLVQKAMAENSKKTSNYDLRGSQFAGGFVDAETVHAHQIGGGINNYTPEKKKNLAEAAAEIQQLLEQLSQTNPTATELEKLTIVAKAADEIKNNPILKARVINALNAEGTEVLKEAIDHPLINILVAMIQGWTEAE